MTTVIVSRTTVKTDAFAGLSLDSVTYSTVTLSWTNVSSGVATFRIVGKSTYEDVVVPGGEKGTYTVTGLTPKSTQNFYLERFEIDEYVRQTSSTSGLDYVSASTYSNDMSVSTGSSAVKLSWTNPGLPATAEYLVRYTQTDRESYTSEKASGTSHVISGLEDGVDYYVQINALENGEMILLDEEVFTTTSNVAMEIVNVYASYVELDWADSVEGSAINYRIVSRAPTTKLNSTKEDIVIVENTEETEALISVLTPGTTYRFVLQRLEVDGNWEDQNTAVVKTLSTDLSIGSVGSKSMMVSWSNMYPGAVYEVFYNNKSAGQTTGTEMVLKNLESDTEYDIELAVIELGETVGLAKLGIQTNKRFIRLSNMPLVTGVLLVILLAIVMMRMRN